MAANMKVQTNEVATAKSTIQGKASDLKAAYQKIFDNYLVKIDDAWDGDDNTEFNTRKQTFRKDFEELDDFLERFIAFLEKVKTDYEKAESDTKAAAGKLAK